MRSCGKHVTIKFTLYRKRRNNTTTTGLSHNLFARVTIWAGMNSRQCPNQFTHLFSIEASSTQSIFREKSLTFSLHFWIGSPTGFASNFVLIFFIFICFGLRNYEQKCTSKSEYRYISSLCQIL